MMGIAFQKSTLVKQTCFIMIRKLLFISALVLLFIHGFAQQTFNELNANNINCSVTATGDLFNRFQSDLVAGFEVPAGSDLRTIYAANLWIAGVTIDEQLKLAAETYALGGTDWFPGPLTVDGAAEVTDETEAAYNQVWKANSADVNQHVLYFMTLESGGQEEVDELFPNGYTIPEWFFDWPAHGDTSLGQDYYLAPFIDQNNNAVYDPENGDYPSFCGDECLFFIFNDKGDFHGKTQGQSLGLEVRGMLYSFHSDSDDMLENTVFLKYMIINQSSQSLMDTYIGLWSDFDIGNSVDDYVGTNVLRSAIYGYNGDETDQGGYEDMPPMQGIVFLSGPYMDEDDTDNTITDLSYSGETNAYGPMAMGFGDGIPDNERLGLCHSISYSAGTNAVNGDPSSGAHYYNYLRGIWKNGQQLMYGGNGISGPGVEDYPANYMYPHGSDPLNVGTQGIEAPFWSETTAANSPGDRRMLGSSGPFTFLPGDVNYLDLAFVFSENLNTDLDSYSIFDERLEEAKLYWNEYLQDCEFHLVTLGSPEYENTPISIFPNPMQDVLSISAPASWNKISLEIFDIAGNLVKSISISGGLQQINIEELSAGTYALKVQYDDQLLTQKIIVQ